MRSLGYRPTDQRWTSRAYPSQYRQALSHANVHIHPEIPVAGYVPRPDSVERMIAVGERAAYRALDSIFKSTRSGSEPGLSR